MNKRNFSKSYVEYTFVTAQFFIVRTRKIYQILLTAELQLRLDQTKFQKLVSATGHRFQCSALLLQTTFALSSSGNAESVSKWDCEHLTQKLAARIDYGKRKSEEHHRVYM